MKTIIAGFLLVTLLAVSPKLSVAEDRLPEPLTAEQHIEQIFGEKAEIAKAVILHESQNKLDAKNWNCHYYNSQGKRYSTFCKKEDRHKAWSVDCGIGQINVRGRACPEELLTLEGNMEAIETIYETQGLNAWVSYKTGAYKKYLD